MNQDSKSDDPKGQGMPPPYSGGPPPPVITTTHTSHTYPPQPMQPPPDQGVVFQTTTATVIPVIATERMGPKSTTFICKSCNEEIVTRVELKASTKTHLFAVLLCCVFWPCVWLPYYIDTCKNTDHYCPNCNAFIGSYKN